MSSRRLRERRRSLGKHFLKIRKDPNQAQAQTEICAKHDVFPTLTTADECQDPSAGSNHTAINGFCPDQEEAAFVPKSKTNNPGSEGNRPGRGKSITGEIPGLRKPEKANCQCNTTLRSSNPSISIFVSGGGKPLIKFHAAKRPSLRPMPYPIDGKDLPPCRSEEI